MRDKIRFKHYSIKTERVYLYLVKNYILYHNKKHPKDMGKIEIEQYLTSLAVYNQVSPATQNQAFNAILFLYEQVLGISLEGENIQALRAKQKKHILVVLSIEEVKQVILQTSVIYTHVVKELNKDDI